MSTRKTPSPARLVVSVIYGDEVRFREALQRICDVFGAVAGTSPPFPFDRTGYYGGEMGGPLYRRFAVMERLVPRDSLSDAKVMSEGLEAEFSSGGKRTVNIDPGLLTEENFCLATGKNFTHRVYLRDGVFADLTLVYRKGGYVPLPWTYPDIASDQIRAFLSGEREGLREARKMETEATICG